MAAVWVEAHLLRDWSNPPPWLLFKVGIWLLALLKRFMKAIQPPPLTLFDIQMGAWQTQVSLCVATHYQRAPLAESDGLSLHCTEHLKDEGFCKQVLYAVAALGIADVLGSKGPQTAEELADTLGVNSNKLYRVLRSAVQMGVFAAVKPGQLGNSVRFKNNRLSAVLREDHPNCLRHMMLHFNEDNKPAFDELTWAVRTGGNAWKRAYGGLSQFEWLQQDPKEEHKFSQAMKQVDGLGTHAMATDYKWGKHPRIVDIGGAYGSFISHLLTINSGPKGVLFDQPQVIERAQERWAEDSKLSALCPRMTFVGGDFFKHETLPEARDGDAYVMRLILHDWDDKDCTAILANVRRAMGSANASLLIVETTLGEEFNDPLFQRGLLDVHMMVVHDGAERTVPHWKEILKNSGFHFSRHIPTRGVFSIVEAVPA